MLLGQVAIGKIFGTGTATAPRDVIPDQVINLVRMQLYNLSERLEKETAQGDYKNAQDDATEAVRTYLPILKEESAKRGAKPY